MVRVCTLTWVGREDGYEVFFSRDEQRSRAAGTPPAVTVVAGERALAPRDGAAGGTWIAVDEGGLTACVLNGFPAGELPEPPAEGYRSRGFLPGLVLGTEGVEAAAGRVASTELTRYRPFLLALFDPGGGRALLRWSGVSLSRDDATLDEQPVISSSYFSERVRTARVAVFREGHGAPRERHLAFHRSHEPERGPLSPCMHRGDARTVSFTHVVVEPGVAWMRYTPDSPCRGVPGRRQTLALRQ